MHAQSIHRDARRLKQIAATDFSRINLQFDGEFIELRLESKAHIDRAVTAHGATCGLVSEHAVAVILNVGDVVERAEQRAGIKNRDHAVRAVAAAILHHTSLYRGDTAIVLDAGLQGQ